MQTYQHDGAFIKNRCRNVEDLEKYTKRPEARLINEVKHATEAVFTPKGVTRAPLKLIGITGFKALGCYYSESSRIYGTGCIPTERRSVV